MKYLELEVDPVKRMPQLEKDGRRTIILCFVTIAIFFGGFGLWSAVAKLSTAAVGTGLVIVQGERKKIQHLSGGIVKEILVKDGDSVKARQVVMRLDDVHDRATRDLILGQYRLALATSARLAAERDSLKEIQFPGELLAVAHEPAVADILAGQSDIFEARRHAYDGQVGILQQRIGQSKQEIAGLNAQVQSEKRQRDLIGQEMVGVKAMIDKGLERKPRYLALQRAAADLEGNIGAHLAAIARANAMIGESQFRMIDLKNQYLKDAADQLKEAQSIISDASQKLRAVEDTLQRNDIRAPVAGKVVGLQAHTIGGVVQPGVVILEIVPQNQKLIVDTQVQPQDIDVVHVGLPASVRLTSLDFRSPTFDGKVTYVSADRLIDPTTRMAYYDATVEIDPKSMADWPGAQLYPGMPAEVMIIVGERTALGYIVSPIFTWMERSMHEQ